MNSTILDHQFTVLSTFHDLSQYLENGPNWITIEEGPLLLRVGSTDYLPYALNTMH